jgi:hypothetical protein
LYRQLWCDCGWASAFQSMQSTTERLAVDSTSERRME